MFYCEAAADKYALKKGSVNAAGYDLVACIDVNFYDAGAAGYSPDQENWSFIKIPSGGIARIDTGVRVAITDKNYYGRIAPRSGLAVRSGIDVLAGVIDADYRGRVVVILINHGKETFVVKDGDRIAQLIIEKIYQGSLTYTDDITSFASARGSSGFGSTGNNTGDLYYHEWTKVDGVIRAGRLAAQGRDKDPL